MGMQIDYYECPSCHYVQTEKPFWYEEAYKEAINDSDTGIMSRNIHNTKIVISALFLLGQLRGKVVDYAGGYGILVRMLRDVGIDAYWADTYAENLVAKGFEHDGSRASLVTAFEVFEHYIYPYKEVGKLLDISNNILFSTTLMPKPTPAQETWWYYGQEHGQHIGFFREETLNALAKKYNKYFVSDGSSCHLFSDRPISKKKWKFYIRYCNINYFLNKITLRPKTWSDYLIMSKRKQGRRL